MKLKPIYIYVGIIVVAVLLLIIFTTNSNKSPDTSSDKMPQDEIHKAVTPEGQSGPSGANVSEEIKKKMENLKEAYEEFPDDTLKMRQYAEFLSMAHKPNEAMVLFEKILKKDSKRTDIRLKLFLIYFHRQDLNSAEKIVADVLKYDKKNGRAKFNLAIISANRGDKVKAKTIMNEIIKENPNTQIAKIAEESIVSMGL